MKRIMQLAVIISLFTAPVLSSNAVLASNEYENDQIICLAKNIYFEARGSSFADQVAVADVVMNRVEHDNYPNTICGVVYQGRQDSNGNMIRHQCQFSWYCDGKSDEPTEPDSWARAIDIATMVLEEDKFLGITDGADHYFANWIDEEPHWAEHMIFIGNIGNHKFYRSYR